MPTEIKIHSKHDAMVDPNTLKDHPKNRNKHPKSQIQRLVKIFQYQGVRHPIVVSARSGFIVAGHGRKQAAIEAEIAMVPVVYQDFDSDEQEYAFIQSDNAIALWADLDLSGIDVDFTDLGPDFDIEHLGIKNFKIDLCETPPDSDSIPSLPKEAKSKLGDIFRLGPHRLICGDSTMVDDIEKLMAGAKASMVFTDPPYNVDYDPESRASYFSPERLANKLGKIKNDTKTPEKFRQFLDDIFNNINLNLRPGSAIYICHADLEGHNFRNAFIAQPWKMQSCLIWMKTVLVFGRADYHWQHEPILYGWKEGESHRWFGDRKQTSIIEIPTDHYNKKESDTAGYVHPTQKPVGLIKIALNNSSEKGDIVLDLFGGSGSTLIACQQMGRVAYLSELDPKYCDVIIRRYEAFTGDHALRIEADGSEIPWDA